MLPNQNIYIRMAPPTTEFSGTHSHITATSPFSYSFRNLPQPQKLLQKIPKSTPSKSTPTTISVTWTSVASQTTSITPATTLIEKELKKELETVRDVFPELSDNPRDPAIVLHAYHSTTHTSPSTTHHSTSSITHVHPKTISCTITTSNNTPESFITMLSTTLATISTTTTFSVEPVTSLKLHSIKESARITTPKRCPPTLDIFPSRDFRLKRHKKYSSPFTQFQTFLTTATTSNFEPPSTVSTTTTTTTATKPLPKFETSPLISPQPTTTTHSTSATGIYLPSEKDTTSPSTSTIIITPTTTTTTPPT